MKRQKKKNPNDYPLFAFRVSQDDKERLNKLIKQVHVIANQHISNNELKVKKNEIIVSALFYGLLRFKKQRIKRFETSN